MSFTLPSTGTAALLERLADYPPDDFIDGIVPRLATGGRRHSLQASQLWRVHLLALLTSTHSLNLVVAQLPEQRAWRAFARLRRTLPTVRMLHDFRHQLGVGGLRRINLHLLRRIFCRQGVQPHAVAIIDATDLPASCNGLKKREGCYSADHAALGARTIKTGLARWYVGYKKHSLRVWLPTRHDAVTLVPLVSWMTPANVHESRLLLPSLRWLRRHLGWWPGIVVGDMGFIAGETKRAARVDWNVAVVTQLRGDVPMQAPYVTPSRTECPQGQRLVWWEHDAEASMQWFRVAPDAELCGRCWQATDCPGHFGFPSGVHETFFGSVPLASELSRRLLKQVRPWIEPAQSFEKNQLGLGRMFLNSLRLASQMGLLADSVVLLRTMSRLDTPARRDLLAPMRPRQMEFGLD